MATTKLIIRWMKNEPLDEDLADEIDYINSKIREGYISGIEGYETGNIRSWELK